MLRLLLQGAEGQPAYETLDPTSRGMPHWYKGVEDP